MRPPKKNLLLLVGLLILSTAQAKADGTLKNPRGTIIYMTQYEASGVWVETGKKVRPDACRRHTAGRYRLPTIRELAKKSQAGGAKGILEVNQVNPDAVPKGYFKVSAINPDGQKDEFYFNSEGYEGPGEFGYNSYWSSSVTSYNSDHAYQLDGLDGYVFHKSRSVPLAVHCIKRL